MSMELYDPLIRQAMTLGGTAVPKRYAYDPARAFRFSTDGVAVENGHIAYGQVYGVYYARLLDEMLRGVLPEELLPIIEAYFYGM